MTDHIEIMAKRVYSRFPFETEDGKSLGPQKPSWIDGGNSLKQNDARTIARKDEAALTAAGYQIVPVVPTEAMIGAWRTDQAQGRSLQSSYSAMLKAFKDQQP